MQQLAALWSALQGKKTYLLSALAALWPLLAPFLGQSGTFDLQSVLIALAIRDGRRTGPAELRLHRPQLLLSRDMASR